MCDHHTINFRSFPSPEKETLYPSAISSMSSSSGRSGQPLIYFLSAQIYLFWAFLVSGINIWSWEDNFYMKTKQLCYKKQEKNTLMFKLQKIIQNNFPCIWQRHGKSVSFMDSDSWCSAPRATWWKFWGALDKMITYSHLCSNV